MPEVMQGTPQGIPQGPPQGAPQEAQGAGGSFPAGNEEGEQFILQLVKLISTDEEVARVLKEETGGKAPTSAIIGAVAAQLLTLLFSKLYEQTGGQQVSKAFVVQIIRVAVRELADIASGLGTEVSKEEEQQAAKVAGDSLDQNMEQLYSGGHQQAPQGQPQAPPGVMQGQPQGGM